MKAAWFRYPTLLCLMVGTALFLYCQHRLLPMQRAKAAAELEVVLPLFAQVLMTGGDRYLAANLAAIRALVTETQYMKREDYALLGKIQDDVAWLNPAHEDNYYTAAAILPWEGELEPAQRVLARATRARFFDYQPAFYFAFNLVQFKGDGIGAAHWLREAAEKLPNPEERLIMENFAARWVERSDDLELAARIVDAMARSTKRKDFADYLHARSQRLRNLLVLRQAAERYRQMRGRPITTLGDLVAEKLIPEIPKDPLGSGFDVNRNGVPIVRGTGQS